MNHLQGPAALVAVLITLANFLPYLSGVWRGTLRPHVISWVIWGLTTLLVAGGQWVAGAGVGALVILVSGCLSSAVASLAWARQRAHLMDRSVTAFDRFCLVIALLSIPIWLATGDPLWSVLILTGIDLVGFAPTVRAAWRDPYAESILLFLAFAARNAVAIAALEQAHLTTVTFPGVIGATCAGMVVLLLIRRGQVPATSAK